MATFVRRNLLLIIVTLLPISCHCQSIIIQYKMSPFISCDSWTPQIENRVKLFMQTALITEINDRCSCNFNSSQLSQTDLICNRDYPTAPTFRTYIHAHGQFTAARLGRYVEDWVLQTSVVSDGLGYFTIDSSCLVYPDSITSSPCDEESSNSYSAVVLVGSLMAEFVILVVLFFIVMAIVLSVYSSKLKKKKRDLKVQQKKRKRLNSSISHESSCPPRSESSKIDIMAMQMQSCSAYGTSI